MIHSINTLDKNTYRNCSLKCSLDIHEAIPYKTTYLKYNDTVYSSGVSVEIKYLKQFHHIYMKTKSEERFRYHVLKDDYILRIRNIY